MIPYADFKLTEKQIQSIKETNRRKLIAAYIKEHGIEPDSEISKSFYTASNEQLEMYRRAYYANKYKGDKYPDSDDEQPIDTGSTIDSGSTVDSGSTIDSGSTVDSGSTIDSGGTIDSGSTGDNSHTYYICARKAPWTEEEAERYKNYRGMDGCSYEFIQMLYDQENDYYYAKNIDANQLITCYGPEDGNWRNPPANIESVSKHVEFAFTKGTTLANADPLCQKRRFITSRGIFDDKGKYYKFENWIIIHADQQVISELRMVFYTDYSDNYVRFAVYYLDGMTDEQTFLLK